MPSVNRPARLVLVLGAAWVGWLGWAGLGCAELRCAAKDWAGLGWAGLGLTGRVGVGVGGAGWDGLGRAALVQIWSCISDAFRVDHLLAVCCRSGCCLAHIWWCCVIVGELMCLAVLYIIGKCCRFGRHMAQIWCSWFAVGIFRYVAVDLSWRGEHLVQFFFWGGGVY